MKGLNDMDKQKVQQEINKNEVLAAVQNILEQQTLKGLQKYGTTVQPDMHSVVEWIDHTSEETADKLVYLQALKKRIQMMMEENKRYCEALEFYANARTYKQLSAEEPPDIWVDEGAIARQVLNYKGVQDVSLFE